MSQNNVIALIVAGGKSSRFGSNIPKQYCDLYGRPLIYRTLKIFCDHPKIDKVIVVIHPEHQYLYQNSISDLDLLPNAIAGNERSDSVANGLKSLLKYNPQKVIIHDAARPFISQKIISDVIENIEEGQASAPVITIDDTVKFVKDDLVAGTANRDELRRIQTPQGFMFEEILNLHNKYSAEKVTDDVMLFELDNKKVFLVSGSKQNFKITDKEDMTMAQSIIGQNIEYRIGQGFDVHRFCEPKMQSNNTIRLGGVDIPHEKSLQGHSDADVVLHALTDAILGAINAEDIGYHFPPSDDNFKNMDSAIFLTKAKELIAERGAKIINLDITIICEKPKIGPYRPKIKKRIADILDIETDRVSIKATTTEKLGFTGRKEGIATQAIVSVAVPS